MINKKNIVFSLVILILPLFLLAGWLLFTAKGSEFVTIFVLKSYLQAENINIKKTEGRLFKEASFQDIEIKGVKYLPQGSVVKIQGLKVNVSLFRPAEFYIDIFNGTLRLPGSDVIFFYGDFRDGALDFSAYTKYLGAQEVLNSFTEAGPLKNILGAISDFDVYVKGSILEPEFSGQFRIDKFSQNGLFLSDCTSTFRVRLKDINSNIKLYGEVNIKDGLISSRNTTVNIQQCKILFSGDFRKPVIDFKGSSTVERVKIKIALKGMLDAPEIRLTSEPPMPQAQLLVMLATGKSWKGSEVALSQRKVTPELAGDFVDYFIFGGAGNKIAKHLGITDISTKFDSQTKGVAVTKQINGSTEVSYGIEQSQTKDRIPTTTQKVGGGYKITESITIEGEKELKQDKSDQPQEKSKTDDKVILKYKKEF